MPKRCDFDKITLVYKQMVGTELNSIDHEKESIFLHLMKKLIYKPG